ncbi:MAG: hypothetical protein ABIS67_10395 [Candidatus Eisenbacteria bacterium]
MRSFTLPTIFAAAVLAIAPALAAPGSGPGTSVAADSPSPTTTANCAGTSTGRIPLNDLGAGFYFGAQGGLYAGGVNQRPAGHNAAGIAIAQALTAIDTLGNPDPSGSVVLISIGMSNCTQEFSNFVPKCAADPVKRPEVVPIDCAVGGQTASVIKNPAAWYWDSVATRLRGRGSSPLQVQVVWIKEANAGPTGNFSTSSAALLRDFGSMIRTIKDKLPNVKLAYFTSRIYAGYATTALNPEPYAYESGFVVKQLISAQIAGEDSLNYDPGGGAVEAPWMAWGPYLWADGLTPRSDGMTWACADFANDGTHPATSGRAKVADSLLAFFRADETTTPWYAIGAVGVPRAPRTTRAALTLAARPVPASREVALVLDGIPDGDWRIEIVDAGGRKVRSLDAGTANATPFAARWDLRDDAGRRLRPGVYWAHLVTRAARAGTKVVIR